ncbi:MAG: MG2 domain-containing protein, partial [Bacteroidota bacterium]
MKKTLLLALITVSFCGITGMMLLPGPVHTHPLVQLLRQKISDYQYRYDSEKMYCHTDRSLYLPGEWIWASIYLQSANGNTNTQLSQKAYLELLDPKGQLIQRKVVALSHGRGISDFALDPALNGGQYTLKAYTQIQKNYGERDIFQKKIQIQKVVLPRVLMQLDFDRESYGPGQEVVADFSLKNLQNEAITQIPIEAVWQVDGDTWLRQTLETNEEGIAWIQQSLPKDLASRDVRLSLRLEYQELTESISRQVPVEFGDIDLQFLPEGGELIAGKQSKLAFKAVNEFGKGVDVAGLIVNESGQVVDSFRSQHMGMGSMQLLARAEQDLRAQILEPYQLDRTFALPKAQSQAFRIAVEKQTEQQISFRIYHPKGGKVWLSGLQNRSLKEVYEIDCRKGENRYSLDLKPYQMGIAAFMLIQEDGMPLSERLVFVKKQQQLRVEIETNQDSYQPREEVELAIQVKDADGQAVQADLSVAVVDEKNLSFADDKQANLMAHMLLCDELQGEVEEPNYYFDPDEAEGEAHLDLLMLTQGWRRFDWQEMLSAPADRPQ